jgi:CheY-like chemotaxis protein
MDKSSIIQIFINTYNTTCTAENLCKLIHYFFNAGYVAVTWAVHNGYWYIPCVYNNIIHTTGWILTEEPNKNNLPIKVKKVYTYSFKHIMLLVDVEICNDYMYYIQTFIEKLRYDDLLRRNKTLQTIALSNTSHSVRTPLNGIIHLTQDILKDNDTPDMNRLNQSIISLANNIFDILDQTKVELNRVVINKSLINFKQIIASVIDIVAEKIPYHIDDSVPEYIYSDPHRIKQILLILIKNSVQHSVKDVYLLASSTLVNISAENNKGTDEYKHNIKITIKNNHKYDSSIVFAPMIVNCDGDPNLRVSYLLAKLLNGYVELKETCFEFSFLADDEEPVEINNKTLVRLRGKRAIVIGDMERVVAILTQFEMQCILVASVEEYNILYKDTTFDIILSSIEVPNAVIVTEVMTDTDIKLTIISKIQPDDITIMVVEDDVINRIVIEKILKKIGYNNILMMPNGMKALKAYDSSINLLLIDIRMPGMSGFELADAIHQINPDARMIGITAQTVAETDLKPWFKEFVYKPINIEDLKAKIRRLS